MSNPSRWNIEHTEDDGNHLRVCRGWHERSADCEWETFVPAGEVQAERARCAAEVREMWENGVPPQEYAARILAGPEGE